MTDSKWPHVTSHESRTTQRHVWCEDDYDVLSDITLPPLIFPAPKIDDALKGRDAA